ncbi:MAG: glycosyltransferase family 2 protein [Bacteroidetes bacterium]|nr:glycosyltransferase family 2 protein [Bacteroidota bacterium]MBL6943284.1 glycosyltransferase family 2 protein [Bacteroidales bacterium]
MINHPKVSVILPFFNAEKTIESAIKSISSQSFTDFECILIDNNSTDSSWQIAQKFVDNDHRFKLISEKVQGVGFASNAGWKESKGNYIARMDADDWSHPNRLKIQNEFLDNNSGYGAVATLVKHISHSEFSGGMPRFVEWSNAIVTYEEILNSRFVELPIVNPSAMWRREIAQKHGMYLHGDFPEDYEMWLRWFDNGVKIRKLKDVLLNWHDSDTRLSRTNPIYSDKSFYQIKTKYLAKWLKKHSPFYPKVAIWGASNISRRRARLLESHGIEICCYIDTKKNKRHLDQKVYFYENIPSADEIFVLTYIKQMNAKEEIKEFLSKKGFEEGKNFLLVS